MNKVFISILLLVLLTGCSDKYFECNKNIYNEMQDYELNAKYKVYYENSFVTKIEKEEIYISDNIDTLNYFNEYKKLEYENVNNLYGEVIYSINRSENKITIYSTIETELLNIKKMKNNKYIDSEAVINNKIATGGIKNIYKAQGFTCED